MLLIGAALRALIKAARDKLKRSGQAGERKTIPESVGFE